MPTVKGPTEMREVAAPLRSSRHPTKVSSGLAPSCLATPQSARVGERCLLSAVLLCPVLTLVSQRVLALTSCFFLPHKYEQEEENQPLTLEENQLPEKGRQKKGGGDGLNAVTLTDMGTDPEVGESMARKAN